MKTFAWRGYTREGKRRSGVILAADEAEASARLGAEGYFPEEITAEAARPGRGPGGGRQRRLDQDMQAIFARQLAVLLQAGLPVDEALDVIRAAGGGRAMDQVATRVRAGVLEGAPLSGALAAAAAGFPPYITAAIRAGEASRDLAGILETVAEHLETRRTDRAALATALVYPAFVAAASLAVCAILMTTVAPQLAEMFRTTGRPLPALTATMLAVTGWLGRNALPLLAGAGLAALGAALALRRPLVRDRLREALLRLPVIGRLMTLEAATQYLRTLALVIRSRQPVIEGLRSAREVLALRRFRAESDRATLAVEAGASLAQALRHTGFVPPVARQLVEAGEKSARVAQTTDRAADLVETWLVNDRRRLAALIDPILMMVIGGFVLVIVLSVLLPIFDMQNALDI